jgi:hypothetical protein
VNAAYMDDNVLYHSLAVLANGGRFEARLRWALPVERTICRLAANAAPKAVPAMPESTIRTLSFPTAFPA